MSIVPFIVALQLIIFCPAFAFAASPAVDLRHTTLRQYFVFSFLIFFVIPDYSWGTCEEYCREYVQDTTGGCQSLRSNILGKCSEVCASERETEYHDSYSFYIEKKLERGNCFRLSKDRFIEKYTEQCLDMIEEMEGQENSRLICTRK